MSNRIRELRERSKLTQREVAIILGVDESDISRWEVGKRPLTPAAVAKFAALFKVGSWELFINRQWLRRLLADTDVTPGSHDEDIAEGSRDR